MICKKGLNDEIMKNQYKSFQIFLIMSISFLLLDKMCKGLNCKTCTDCLSEDRITEEVTCYNRADACMKLHFEQFIVKLCVIQSQQCSSDGLVKNTTSTWNTIKNIVGKDKATDLLQKRKNHNGYDVISCCRTNNCNLGTQLNMNKAFYVAPLLLLILLQYF